MRNATKIWLTAATVLLLIGSVIFVGVMCFLKWDFTRLDTQGYQTNAHEPVEEFESISVHTRGATVAFLPSDNGACRVVCYEKENLKHAVEVTDGTLTVRVEDTRKWYHHIGLFSHNPAVTVYLPRTEYQTLTVKGSTGDVSIPKELAFAGIDVEVSTGDVQNYASTTGDIRLQADTGNIKNYASAAGNIRIQTNTGDIHAEGFSCNALSLSVTTGRVNVASVTCTGDVTLNVSTGDATLTELSCNSLMTDGDTGELSLHHVTAAGRFAIERSTGDVHFDGCDAAEIAVKTDTGDVTGTLRSDKVFLISTDTGSVEVPKTIAGGRCEITTDTGDIKITVAP